MSELTLFKVILKMSFLCIFIVRLLLCFENCYYAEFKMNFEFIVICIILKSQLDRRALIYGLSCLITSTSPSQAKCPYLRVRTLFSRRKFATRYRLGAIFTAKKNMSPESYNAPPKCVRTLPLGQGKKAITLPLASAAWSAETDCPQ